MVRTALACGGGSRRIRPLQIRYRGPITQETDIGNLPRRPDKNIQLATDSITPLGLTNWGFYRFDFLDAQGAAGDHNSAYFGPASIAKQLVLHARAGATMFQKSRIVARKIVCRIIPDPTTNRTRCAPKGCAQAIPMRTVPKMTQLAGRSLRNHPHPETCRLRRNLSPSVKRSTPDARDSRRGNQINFKEAEKAEKILLLRYIRQSDNRRFAMANTDT
jgi:hypothetical protein